MSHANPRKMNVKGSIESEMVKALPVISTIRYGYRIPVPNISPMADKRIERGLYATLCIYY
jgi:hypothetical protein